MSTFNENTEHEDRPEFDDNGEPIIYIEEDVIPDEFASEYDGVIDLDVQDDSFYETVWGGDASSVATLAADDSTTGEEVTDPLEVEVEQDTKDTTENDGILDQAKEDYDNAVDILIDILTQALAQGEISEEMNASILDAQGTKTKNEQIIKEICNVQEDNSILKQLADIKANMVAASVDDIIDILTEGGTKPWLYKDSDNNVLVDSQSIPELTVLVNKLNLIATGGDEASEIQLTPEFIKLISSNINITAENITLEGLVTANENFKILEDGSMMAKNGYFTGQIFVGDGSVIGDAALSDTIRNGANNGTLAIQKLNVVDADIENLKANKADITDLHATNAEIDNLKANKADIEYLDANYATIENLNATNANITNLQATKANIIDLNAANANIANLQAIKANITDLDAAKADINVLNSDVANIQTLVNGNLTSDNIQSMVITGDKFTVANGFIKNAMIDSINANKINTGTINTNNVKIQSADGSMVINGTTQQFKDKNNKVRIQIGKDAQGNFTFALFSQDGVGVLIDETGIKSGAVPDGLIVNDMVSDSANISGSKLDINSVISSINNGTTTIKGTRIQLDEQGQSLQVAFSQLKSKVETIENISIEGDLSSVIEQVTSNTTSINTMQGQISSLISNTTITKANGEVVQLKDEYNSTKDTVNSHSTKIGSLETNLATANNNISSVSSKQATLEQNLNGFKQTVSDTYTTKADFNGLTIGGTNLYPNSNFKTQPSYTEQTGGSRVAWNSSVDEGIVTTKYNGKVVQLSDSQGTSSSPKDVYLTFGQTVTLQPNTTYTLSFDYYSAGAFRSSSSYIYLWKTKDDVSTRQVIHLDIVNNNKNKTRLVKTFTTDSEHLIFQFRIGFHDTGACWLAVDGVKLEKGNRDTSWAPAPEDIDTAIDIVDGKFTNYSTTSQMNSAITQKANEITSTVSQTYATKASVTDVSNNLKNNYSTTSAMNSAIKQKADSILSTVSNTYATTQSTSALLKESITEYYLSTSNTTLSGGAWGTTSYTPTPGKYIWQRTKSVTKAGDIKYSNPICVSDEMYTVMLKNEVLLLKCNSDGEVI